MKKWDLDGLSFFIGVGSMITAYSVPDVWGIWGPIASIVAWVIIAIAVDHIQAVRWLKKTGGINVNIQAIPQHEDAVKAIHAAIKHELAKHN